MMRTESNRTGRGVRMRSLRWIGIAAVIAALAGCGDRNLILKVDVLSYLDPNLTNFAFGPVPPSPGGFQSGEQPVVKDQSVNLVSGTNNIAEVQNVSITMRIAFYDSTGSGADTLRVYMSDDVTDPSNTPVLVEIPITLNPGIADTLETTVGGDQRVADLFSGETLRVTVTTSVRGPSSGSPLNGRVQVQALEATLLASRKKSI
jgi:hypothetical protein